MEGIRRRYLGVIVAALAAAIALAACSDGSSDGGNSPAMVVPESAPIYLEADLASGQEEGGESAALAEAVLGTDDLNEFVIGQLEGAVQGSGESIDFAKEVEPWIGEKAGLYLARYDGGDFHGLGLAVEATDPKEAEAFVKAHPAPSGGKGGVLQVVDDYLVFGESKDNLKEMTAVAEGGESLAESSTFKSALDAVPDEGVGFAYVDFGALISQSKGALVSQLAQDLLGEEAHEATAIATLVPHAEGIEIDITATANGVTTLGGDASALLESMPATSAAAFSSAEFGERFGGLVDQLDENGIPGQFKPGEIKLALGAVGIDVDALAESLGDVAGFVEGSSPADLGGAVVVETSNAAEATKLVGNLGLLLKAAGNKGVTATSGELAGFSAPLKGLRQPLVVGAAGEKIVIAAGAKAAAQALRANGKTLGSSADFGAAKAALGSTPINAFLTGAPALKLIEAMLPAAEQKMLAAASPLLAKVTYAALGSEAGDGTTTAKVIIGVQK